MICPKIEKWMNTEEGIDKTIAGQEVAECGGCREFGVSTCEFGKETPLFAGFIAPCNKDLKLWDAQCEESLTEETIARQDIASCGGCRVYGDNACGIEHLI